MARLRLGIVGYGKIARDQHVPAIAADPHFELAALVSPRAPGPQGVRCFATHGEMLAAGLALDAVAICTPPGVRYAIARDCLLAGLHLLLEKPPGVTLGEVAALADLATQRKLTLFTTWHARENPAVSKAVEQLAGRPIESVRIDWCEDVRKWHPGQEWIWQPGGFGVFDPGINAFSIMTRLLPDRVILRRAELAFPSNRAMPIAADLVFESPAVDGQIECALDWRGGEQEIWTIGIQAGGETIRLVEGGGRLLIDGRDVPAEGPAEYPALYARFAEMVEAGRSEVDVEPLRIVADAFMAGTRTTVGPFEA